MLLKELETGHSEWIEADRKHRTCSSTLKLFAKTHLPGNFVRDTMLYFCRHSHQYPREYTAIR